MDFEAKARELLAVLPARPRVTGAVEVLAVADALRAAALDEGARAAARAELARLLAELRRRALDPPLLVGADPPPGVSPEQYLLESLSAYQESPVTPGGWQVSLAPGPEVTLARLLERLLWLLGLSEGERRFVAALADDAADFASLEVFADWLEDEGRTKDGVCLRRLVPKDGGLIVWTVSGGEDPVRLTEVRRHAQALCDALQGRGLHTLGAVVPQGVEVNSLGVEAMRAAGWVRAEEADERVAQEAWACAAVAAGQGALAAAQAIRDHRLPPAPEAPP